jgi:hypothetical protein
MKNKKLEKSDICLSDPTADGSKFALKFFDKNILISA